MKKTLLIVLFSGLLFQGCNLFSDPKCELKSYKLFGNVSQDAVYVKFEVENVSKNDYAYGVKCQVKAYSNNSVLQIKETAIGTVKAAEIVESTVKLDSLNSLSDTDHLKLVLIWYGESDAKFSKIYDYTP